MDGWLVGLFIGEIVGWLNGWLVGWIVWWLLVGWLVGFYDITPLVGYLMPNPVMYIYIHIYHIISYQITLTTQSCMTLIPFVHIICCSQ